MSDVYVRDPENDLTYDSSTGSYVLTSSLTSDYTLTIVPTPSDATVTLTADGYTQAGNSITVPEGFTVIYSIVRPGYAQKRDSVVVDSDITLNITLDQAEVDIINESTTVKELEVNSTVYDIVGKGILDQNTKTTQLEWFGTLEEYNALEEYSDYCTYYITDDLGISNEYDLGHLAEIINDFDVDAFKPEVDAIKNSAISDINEATSNSVEQIKNMGEVVNYTNITNCITEIPQDIKLEIDSNGYLILKAGSKLYVPNGTGMFDVITVLSDTRMNTNSTGTYILFCRADAVSAIFSGTGKTSSGATDSLAGQTYHTWYDTTNNFMYRYSEDGTTPKYNLTLPLAIVTMTTGGICTSIDQVFNGFGYIGSTMFALPGVKVLAPYGRNEDGSLKNYSWTASRVVVRTGTYSGIQSVAIICTNGSFGVGEYYYNNYENFNYASGAISDRCCVIGEIVPSGDKIGSFITKPVFHAVDYSVFKPVQDHSVIEFQAPTSENNYTWYRKYADGWVEQGGVISATVTSITLPVKMVDNNYPVQIFYVKTATTSNVTFQRISTETQTTTGFTSPSANADRRWQVCGMAA